MIIPILILSAVIIAIGLIVTVENAKYLLSGYNTMTDAERENIDIKSYIAYFRKFHLFLGISLFLGASVLLYFMDKDWSELFLGTYPILAYLYFIWKVRQFSKKVTIKQKLLTYLAMLIMALLLVVMVYEFRK